MDVGSALALAPSPVPLDCYVGPLGATARDDSHPLGRKSDASPVGATPGQSSRPRARAAGGSRHGRPPLPSLHSVNKGLPILLLETNDGLS